MKSKFISANLNILNRWMWVGLLALAVLSAFTDAFAADTLILPDNPGINYYGRFDFSNPKAPRFNWSGSTIEFLVSGSASVGMELTDGAGYYDIEIDGKAQSTPVFAGSWTSKKYVLAAAISPDSHVIRIVRRNEPYWAIATFSGIYLSSGAIITPKAKPVRKMEFCGDSWTAGYFIEACADQQMNTNVNKSWARLTSKAFKAQDIILAESGIGLVKGLGGKTSFPAKYMGTFDTMGGAQTPVWKFSSWIPDIVTIFLGINDKSSSIADSNYITAIHSFVNTIRSNYPATPILFISLTGCMDQATRAAVTAETTSIGHKGIHFLECKQQVSGCSYHPDIADDQEIADSVIAMIRKITGWDTASVTTTDKEIKRGVYKTAKINAAVIDSRTVLISSQQATAAYPVQVINANGRIFKQLKFDLSGTCRWNTAQTPKGIYFVGSAETGWTGVFIK
jgi:lysophospholipase L1-like esterase